MTATTHALALALATVLAVAVAAGPAGAQDPPEADSPADPGCSRIVPYDASLFGAGSNHVRHPYLPLTPGTRRVFEGRSNATGRPLEHRVSFTVTALTKVVDGVKAAVVWDVDSAAGRVTEAELAFFAQDRLGRVWNLGEYPEEYPQGLFIGAPNTWLAGVGDAEPGIHMPAWPRVGQPEYLQGSVPDIEFLDCATVFQAGATVCPPLRCYDGVLVVHERSPLDPGGGIQVKYHAPGVGIVQIGAIDDPEAETLVLTERTTLDAAALAEADEQARILDQRGMQCSDVYGQTEPMTGPHDGDFGPYSCAVLPAQQDQVVTHDSVPAFGSPATAPPAPAATAVPAANPLDGDYYTRVDHPLLPLLQVRESVLGGRRHGAPVRIERRVRPKRKHLGAIGATAIDVRVLRRGRLVERSTEYVVQDRARNVLDLGRRVTTLRHGRATGHVDALVAGRDGARAGVVLPARPELGQRFRRAHPAGAAGPRARVVAVGAVVATPAGRFTGCVKVRTTRRGHPATEQAYCPSVGLVRERSGRDRVDLVRYRGAPTA